MGMKLPKDVEQHILETCRGQLPPPAPVDMPPSTASPAEPLADSMLGTVACQINLVGVPQTKYRVRVVNGRAYNPKKNKVAEQAIRTQLTMIGCRPDSDHLMRIDVVFRQPDGHRRDLDNMLKLLLDACNGHVWRDDMQVVEIHALVRRSAGEGTDLTVTRVARATKDCKRCGKNLGPCATQKTFCSPECHDEWQRRFGEMMPCKHCGEPVYRSPSHAGDTSRRRRCAKCRGPRLQREFCKRGHPMTPDNLIVRADGARLCKLCNALRAAESRARKSGGTLFPL